MSTPPSIGILAYGSLIDDPSHEISEKIVDRLKCTTPFHIEFARKSKSRSNAPTLIPVEEGGSSVNAVILVLKDVTTKEAEDMIWRRETRTEDISKPYPRKKNPAKSDVVVKRLINFHGIDIVLYTSIGQNIARPSGAVLSNLAINSFLDNAGDSQKDGLHYLLNARRNGIETSLSKEYENEILKYTHTQSLEEAIEKLQEQKPRILGLRNQIKDFEIQYSKLVDLIHRYGLDKTLGDQKPPDTKEALDSFLKEHKKDFYINVHEGFKQGQNEILQLMLDFEDEKEALEIQRKKLTGKGNQFKREIIIKNINQIEFCESLLRHLIDSLARQIFQGQLYISRRFYQGVKGKKKLRSSNIESVIIAAEQLNKNPEDFALITDLSAYIQVGDIILISKGSLNIVEVKEGDTNHAIIEILKDISEGNKPSIESCKGFTPTAHFDRQLKRTVKQVIASHKVGEIINTDRGQDKDEREVRIITPKEDTPYLDYILKELETQLNARGTGYTVVDDCLHIGLYKDLMLHMGPLTLKGIAKRKEFNYVMINYKAVVNSLYRPIFTLPFSKDLSLDILFGRASFYLMLDLDAFLKLFEEYGLSATRLSRKESAQILEKFKGSELLVVENCCICIEQKDNDMKMYISKGMIEKICFEFISPSYIAYSCLYNFQDDSKQT